MIICSILRKVERVELDLQYVVEHARGAVDIIFVMDVSGSIDGEEYDQSKIFVKDFLDYFSIAPDPSQVMTCINKASLKFEFVSQKFA